MNIHWSPNAMRELKHIYEYYKDSQSLNFARKFRKKIFDKVGLLKSFPKLGKKINTSTDEKEFRFLIEGHYKIVYSCNEETIDIESIIDSRSGQQNF